MPYSTKSDVKKRLVTSGEGIDPSDTTYDVELDDLIEEADAYIDNKLKNYTTVPLSTVPTIVKKISANLAAGLFRRARSPPGESVPLWNLGVELLDDYIAETYEPGKAGVWMV